MANHWRRRGYGRQRRLRRCFHKYRLGSRRCAELLAATAATAATAAAGLAVTGSNVVVVNTNLAQGGDGATGGDGGAANAAFFGGDWRQRRLGGTGGAGAQFTGSGVTFANSGTVNGGDGAYYGSGWRRHPNERVYR